MGAKERAIDNLKVLMVEMGRKIILVRQMNRFIFLTRKVHRRFTQSMIYRRNKIDDLLLQWRKCVVQMIAASNLPGFEFLSSLSEDIDSSDYRIPNEAVSLIYDAELYNQMKQKTRMGILSNERYSVNFDKLRSSVVTRKHFSAYLRAKDLTNRGEGIDQQLLRREEGHRRLKRQKTALTEQEIAWETEHSELVSKVLDKIKQIYQAQDRFILCVEPAFLANMLLAVYGYDKHPAFRRLIANPTVN